MSKRPIPIIDLPAQYRALKPDINRAIQRVLERGQFILGPEVEALERELAAYCGAAHAVGVASGTDALELALRACGVGPGHEVITSAFSFIATAEAIIAVGAVPVFVDIDPVTYTLDPSKLATAMSSRTKAILPVHLYGHPADMGQVAALAKAHRLKLIEDCAQAIGATWAGRRVGSFGDAGALSFFPTKNLGAYGDGGMVVTEDPAVAQRVRLLRAHGSRRKYHHEMLGHNSRLDELQAAILRVKLSRLESWNEARRRLALRYRAAFKAWAGSGIVLPEEQPGCRHVYHLYTIRLAKRARVQRALADRRIGHQIAYPAPLPRQPALKPWVRRGQRFPQAEQVSREVLSLPLYPELTAEQIRMVVRTVGEAL